MAYHALPRAAAHTAARTSPQASLKRSPLPRWKWTAPGASLGLVVLATLVAMVCGRTSAARAQTGPAITLFVNPKTHVVYTEAGPGRVPLGTFGQITSASQLKQQIEQNTQAQLAEQKQQLEQQFSAQQEQQREWNADVAKQISEMEPAWREFGDRWYKKISIGTLVYGDWGMYTHTGWGPAFQQNIYTPGPGNDAWNSFDLNRVYLDARFTPDDNIGFRLTTEYYRQLGAPQPDKFGRLSAVNSNLDGQPGIRLKYAYMDYKTFFQKVAKLAPAKDDVITFGMQQNPFVTWEENLWGYRYVTLSPWNFLGYSSAATGIRVGGPIKFQEKQYVDYEIGVFDNGNNDQYDLSNDKQFAERVSAYPFGAKSQFQGLGFTEFFDYGYPNTYAPDRTLTAAGLPLAGNAAANAHSTRTAFLASYQADTWQLAGEFDWGHNAFTASNYFSGAAPVDAFSSSFVPSSISCKEITKVPATPSCSFVFPSSPYASWAKMVGIFQNASNSVQEGWDFFGHWDIPETPFTAFGLFQQLLPNMNVSKNPLDFQRWVGGVEWHINKNLRLAIDSQNLLYYHSQFDVPASAMAPFTHFGKAGSSTAPFSVTDAVPTDVHAFYINFEFRY
jgi:hypothetical protein